MNFSVQVTVLIKFIIAGCCFAFDFTKFDSEVDSKRVFSETVLEPALGRCAWEWGRWGVTLERMHKFAADPWKNYRDDSDVFDCAWGCFFLRMGWLDQDIEGSFQPQVVLKHLSQYYDGYRIRKARRIASSCVFVNYPHQGLSGSAPDCEQAKLLKNCLIRETKPNITDANKAQLVELLYDWLKVCADLEGLDAAEVVARARRPPPRQLDYPAPPALHGCVWRCLLYDMGWFDEDNSIFLLIVMRETIKLYYREEDKIKVLLKIAGRCVRQANHFWENADVVERPHGCDRAQLLVDCLVRDFLNPIALNSSTTKHGSRSVWRRTSAPAPVPAAARAPHEPLVRMRVEVSDARPAVLHSLYLHMSVDDGGLTNSITVNKTFENGAS